MRAIPEIETRYTVTLKLTEIEARALDAMIGYGIEPFLRVFYTNLGKNYMEPHEAGIRVLFKAIGEQVCPQLGAVNAARKATREALSARGTLEDSP